MAGEITALCAIKANQQPILCFSPTEVFSADNFGNYTHLWEISKPCVTAPAYFDPNPCGPVPPPGSNQAASPTFCEQAKMQAFGNFTGTAADVYTVKANADNTFQWMKASVGTYSAPRNIIQGAIMLEFGICIRFFSQAGFSGTEVWTFYVFKPVFTVNGYSRWQLAPYEQTIFFANQTNGVRYLNGTTINTFAWATDSVPSGRHVYIFMKHLFVTEPVFNGIAMQLTVMWSNVNEYMKFETQLFINEADNYTFDDDIDCPEVPLGITGLAELNPIRIGFGPPRLVIYTAHAQYMLEYKGLPFVMEKTLLNDKVGCAFPYGLVASKHMHLFPASDNFYMMEKDGEARPIGDRVFAAFMELLSENTDFRYRTYGYLDQVRREVWWVFCSKQSTGDFDMKVGYNYISDTWQFAQASEHSFLHTRLVTEPGQQIQNDMAVIDTDNEIIGGADTSVYQNFRLYGQANKVVSYEVLDNVTEVDQEMDEPSLTTGDIIYDPGKIVDMDGMYIHADYDPGSCAGIEVAYSARTGIEDSIEFKIPPKLWTRELKENKYSWPRCSGRIFRLRFTFKKQLGAPAVRGAKFFFWNEIIKGMNEDSEK